MIALCEIAPGIVLTLKRLLNLTTLKNGSFKLFLFLFVEMISETHLNPFLCLKMSF